MELFEWFDPVSVGGVECVPRSSFPFSVWFQWFANKCDLILLLFDPHKLDISDEFKRVITSLGNNADKIRVVLNKADQIGPQQVSMPAVMAEAWVSMGIYHKRGVFGNL